MIFENKVKILKNLSSNQKNIIATIKNVKFHTKNVLVNNALSIKNGNKLIEILFIVLFTIKDLLIFRYFVKKIIFTPWQPKDSKRTRMC